MTQMIKNSGGKNENKKKNNNGGERVLRVAYMLIFQSVKMTGVERKRSINRIREFRRKSASASFGGAVGGDRGRSGGDGE